MNQKILFKRTEVIRSADIVERELKSLSENLNIHYVNIYHDIIGLLPIEYVKKVFSNSYNLNVYYELANIPSYGSFKYFIEFFSGRYNSFFH